MNKLNSLVMSTLVASFLVGCGGGSSSSSTGTTETTTVPVTKGPLLMATAVDSSNPVKTGTQISGTNKYSFTGTITYPITVTGGYVDVNNHGIIDAGDYEFTGKLSSYSTVVTPITTYLGDTTTSEGKAKLETLKALTGVTSDDDLLKKDPVETNINVLAALNSIYETYSVLMDDDTTNDDVSNIDSTILNSKFENYKTAISQSGKTDLAEALIVVEQELKNNVPPEKVLTALDAKKINFTKASLVGKKLVYNEETYFFRENDVVLGDTTPDYTEILSYGTLKDGSLTLNFKQSGKYDVISLTENDNEYTVTYYYDNVKGNSWTFTSDLTKYTEAELNEALADVAFVLTSDMISGKQNYISDSEGTYTGKFYSDGKYSEVWNDTVSGGNSGTCTGTWKIDTNLIITSTCSDNKTPETNTIVFKKQPAAGVSFEVFINGVSDGVNTITSISNIDSTSTDNSGIDSSTFTLTESMLNDKVVYFEDSLGFSSFTFSTYDSRVKAGAFYEYTHDNGETPKRCYGDWALDTTKANTITIDSLCTGDSNYTTTTITFPSEPKAGLVVNYVASDESGSATISEIGNSFISGKAVKVSDIMGSMTATFDVHGQYSETGTDSETGDWSCSGYWADLGNNKIGVTCDDNGATYIPDGVVDSNSNEITLQFSSSTLVNQGEVSVTDADGTYPMTITSFSNIQR